MVKMNGAFSAAIDSPARFCFMVTKAGKPKSACPPRLIMEYGATQLRDILSSRWAYGGRETGACIPAAASASGQAFVPSLSQNPARCPAAQIGRIKTTTPPIFPSAAPAGITHYTLLRKVVCQREAICPLWKPPFCRRVATVRICGQHPHPSKTQRSSAHQPTTTGRYAPLLCPSCEPGTRDKRRQKQHKYFLFYAVFGLCFMSVYDIIYVSDGRRFFERGCTENTRTAGECEAVPDQDG